MEDRQIWACELFKNYGFVAYLTAFSKRSMENSHAYLVGLCFDGNIQIGENYRVRLGDQTFKPYGNNTTYL